MCTYMGEAKIARFDMLLRHDFWYAYITLYRCTPNLGRDLSPNMFVLDYLSAVKHG